METKKMKPGERMESAGRGAGDSFIVNNELKSDGLGDDSLTQEMDETENEEDEFSDDDEEGDKNDSIENLNDAGEDVEEEYEIDKVKE